MSGSVPPRDQELALQRFFELLPREQLVVYRAIRDYLAGRITETTRDRVVEERAGALDALAAVAGHLKLEPGRAPTASQFDVAARALNIGWNRARVQRAWGRWRFARDVFLGAPLFESAAQRDHRLAHQGRKRSHAGHLEGLRWWLRTKPLKLSIQSYTAWAREYNESRPEGRPPVVTGGNTISLSLGMTWPDAVRFARGEITKAEATPMSKRPTQRLCRGPYDFISKPEIGEMFSKTAYALGRLISDPDFPRAAVVINADRLWVRSDVNAHLRGEAFPARKKNELRHLYLTRKEVAAMAGMSIDGVSAGERGMPGRAVVIGPVHLWLRAEVEERI